MPAGIPDPWSERNRLASTSHRLPEAWRESQQALEELNQQLQRAVRAFPAERLPQQLGSEYSAYTQFAGTPQHDLYHVGQVVLLKKALAASRGGATGNIRRRERHREHIALGHQGANGVAPT
jgi:hypothetical protein